MESDLVQIVAASQDALAAGDFDRYLSLLAADVEVTDPLASLRGREAVRQHLGEMFGSVKTVTFLERKLFRSGRKVAMKFTLRLETHAGREGTFEGIDVFEFDDAHAIARITSFFDPTSVAALMSPG